MVARQGRRCRDRKPATGSDPGEWSRSGDESPETADSAQTKPSPTAANGPEPESKRERRSAERGSESWKSSGVSRRRGVAGCPR